MPEPVLPSTARVLLARTARVQREGRAPSLVAGVVRDGGLAWSAGRGAVPEPHTDVQYRLGSISKTVTAVVGHAAARRGPSCTSTTRSTGTCPAPRSATARSASCSPTWPAPPRRAPAAGGSARRAARWRTSPSVRTTSSSGAARRFHYSNLGFGLLGELVARHARDVLGRRRHRRGAGAAGHDADDAAPGRPSGRGARRPPVGRRRPARARAPRRRDGGRRTAVVDAGRPRPVRRLPARRHRRTCSPRRPSRR